MRSRKQRRLPFRPIVKPGRLVRVDFTGTQPQVVIGVACDPKVIAGVDDAVAAMRALGGRR